MQLGHQEGSGGRRETPLGKTRGASVRGRRAWTRLGEAGVKQTVSRELASIDERDVRARGRLLHAFSTGWVKGEEEALNKSLGVPDSPLAGDRARS